MACPAENTWLGYLAGGLPDASLRELERHLDGCPSCRLLYAGLARSDDGEARTPPPLLAPATPPELAPGTVVGRYVVVGLLGRGGMGVVYKAFDPELDRAIALKLVGLGGLSPRHAETARRRLLREAKTLARLSHPNVVAVHDVGTFAGDLFVAMEHVAGVTLRAWLAEAPRRPREILDVFLAAGAGLAAAHRLGIVHRDFKPENVMIGDDGRVRVLDFGLARSVARLRAPSDAGVASAAASGLGELTRDGSILGTPAYMAPEQDAGERVDARGDQFSFCAALYEALYGERPFAGDTYLALAASRAAGDIAPPPRRRGVRRRVERAIVRGLAPSPARRHADMEALLAELGRPARVTPARLAVGVVLAGAVTAAALGARSAPSIAETCAETGAAADAVWTPLRRVQLLSSFAASGHPRAREVAERIVARFDAWTAAWATERSELCAIAMRGASQTETRVAERIQCLERRLSELDANVYVLSRAFDPELVDSADISVQAMPEPGSCDSLAPVAMSDAAKEAAQPGIQRILRGQLALNAGEAAEARRLAGEAVTEARALLARPDATEDETRGARGVLALGLRILGQAHAALGDLDQAHATLREAVRAASAVREDGLMADAWNAIIALSFQARRPEPELRAAIFGAQVAAVRLEASDVRRADVAYHVGSARVLQGELDAAAASLEEARALHTAAGADARRLQIAMVDNSLAHVYGYGGQWAKAHAALDRALAGLEPLGPENFVLGIVVDNLGGMFTLENRVDEAAATFERAISIFENAGAAGRPYLVSSLQRLALVRAKQGRCADAAPLLARARDIAAGAPRRGESAIPALTEGLCQLERGDAAGAVRTLARAAEHAAESPSALYLRPHVDFALARAHWQAGDRPRARALAEQARAGLSRFPGSRADLAELETWMETALGRAAAP